MKVNLFIVAFLVFVATVVSTAWADGGPCGVQSEKFVRYSCQAAPDAYTQINSNMDDITAQDGDGVYSCMMPDPKISLQTVQVIHPAQSNTFSVCQGNSTLTITDETVYATVSYQGVYTSCEMQDSPRLNQSAQHSLPMLCNETTYEYQQL